MTSVQSNTVPISDLSIVHLTRARTNNALNQFTQPSKYIARDRHVVFFSRKQNQHTVHHHLLQRKQSLLQKQPRQMRHLRPLQTHQKQSSHNVTTSLTPATAVTPNTNWSVTKNHGPSQPAIPTTTTTVPTTSSTNTTSITTIYLSISGSISVRWRSI